MYQYLLHAIYTCLQDSKIYSLAHDPVSEALLVSYRNTPNELTRHIVFRVAAQPRPLHTFDPVPDLPFQTNILSDTTGESGQLTLAKTAMFSCNVSSNSDHTTPMVAFGDEKSSSVRY